MIPKGSADLVWHNCFAKKRTIQTIAEQNVGSRDRERSAKGGGLGRLEVASRGQQRNQTMTSLQNRYLPPRPILSPPVQRGGSPQGCKIPCRSTMTGILTSRHPGGKLKYNNLVFVDFGRCADSGPKTCPNGPGSKNGADRA